MHYIYILHIPILIFHIFGFHVWKWINAEDGECQRTISCSFAVPNWATKMAWLKGLRGNGNITLPKTNIAPENGWLECWNTTYLTYLLGWPIFRCYVSCREGITKHLQVPKMEGFLNLMAKLFSFRKGPKSWVHQFHPDIPFWVP